MRAKYFRSAYRWNWAANFLCIGNAMALPNAAIRSHVQASTKMSPLKQLEHAEASMFGIKDNAVSLRHEWRT